ncbi:uncharacterized protein EV154DRAFT_136470 [Mucor mucedo]|uniref:uncharacterized protein n=1 Tax=Mucor mucedo TaxID=29922 RepID=UPI002221017E|nr:uncharacterized protein EV154DRAFT_136470 [Mucor mucedo]KAI7868372.1 hypothetical protein EV154DRAFT_136470 [Mucor mucedo]
MRKQFCFVDIGFQRCHEQSRCWLSGNTVSILTKTSATPTYVEPSATTTYVEPSATPTYVETSATPTYVETSAAPTYVETSAAPTYVEISATPTYVETSATTAYVETSAAPTYVEISATPTYVETSARPTYVEELALNGIMWLDDRYRRAYLCKEDTWKLAMEEVCSAYKEGETYDNYKDIDDISELMRRSLSKTEDEIFR